ncbi:hypothetical protein ACP70R_041065 [Stipagrostis hirtigluma subsp. patula]
MHVESMKPPRQCARAPASITERPTTLLVHRYSRRFEVLAADVATKLLAVDIANNDHAADGSAHVHKVEVVVDHPPGLQPRRGDRPGLQPLTAPNVVYHRADGCASEVRA